MHCPFLNLLGWGGSSYNFPNAFCKRGRSLPAPSALDIRKWWKRQCWISRFHHSYANVKMWVKVIQSKQLACIIDRDATEEKLMAVSWKGILHWMVGSWLYTVEAGKNCFRTKLSSLSHFETPPDQIAILQLNTINPERNIWTIVNDLRKDPYKRETLSKPIDSTFAETSKQSLLTFCSSWAGLLLSVRWENPREPLWEARQKVGPRIEYGLPCQPTWTSIYNMLTTWRLPGDYLGTTWGRLGDYLGTTWGTTWG